MPTKYGRSPWIDRFPKSRVPSHPALRGRLDADVVIVGGGLTGCATAYAFAAAGVKVALLEAGQIGRGSAGGSTGWIADDPGASFLAVERAVGLRAARRAWQAWRRAAMDFAALVRRLDLRCQLQPRATIHVAMTVEQAARLKREHKTRRDAGLDAALLNARAVAGETGIGAVAGLRSRDGATLDPHRAALGLAVAAIERGAHVFGRSPAKRIAFHPKFVDVETAGGAVRADRVVVATGIPTPLFKPLVRHFSLGSTYFALTGTVPAKVRHGLGRRTAVVHDSAVPSHIIRWVGDEQLLVAGADSNPPPVRLHERMVIQRTGQLMYELSTIYPEISGILPAYGWEAPCARTAHGLPFIGPHRNYPRHLFAFGDTSHSVTGAYLASRILLRHYLDDIDSADEAFGFAR